MPQSFHRQLACLNSLPFGALIAGNSSRDGWKADRKTFMMGRSDQRRRCARHLSSLSSLRCHDGQDACALAFKQDAAASLSGNPPMGYVSDVVGFFSRRAVKEQVRRT